MERRRFKQPAPLDHRLTEQAERLRKKRAKPRQALRVINSSGWPGKLKPPRT